MADQFTSVPEMSVLSGGVGVDPIVLDLSASPDLSHGAVSVGASHLPGVGAVFHLGVHSRDGTGLVATFSRAAFERFAFTVGAVCDRLMTGEYDQPEVRQ